MTPSLLTSLPSSRDPTHQKKQHSLLYLSQQHTRVGRPGFVYEDLIDGGSRKARRRVCHFAVRGGQAPFCYLYYLPFLSSLADGVAAAVTYVPSAWFGMGNVSLGHHHSTARATEFATEGHSSVSAMVLRPCPFLLCQSRKGQEGVGSTS